jgi:F0F1-type ATP synthase membrane subunit b/b'
MQHDIDEAKRKEIKVLKHEVLAEVKGVFEEASETLKSRSIEDQNLLGNLITITESELKKRIKSLQEIK